ncbi:MAG: hypothetical protein Q9177_005180 [Variospora cf. flavescens]
MMLIPLGTDYDAVIIHMEFVPTRLENSRATAMPFNSPFRDLEIPRTNVLLYLFPRAKTAKDTPLWIDKKNSEESIGATDLLQWITRIGVSLNKLGINEGEVIRLELSYQLKDTGARLLLTHPALLATACNAAAPVGLPSNQILLFSEKDKAPINGIMDWRTVLGSDVAAGSHQWKHMTEEESTQTVAAINYSSGTTGLPKGVCVSHYNLIASVAQTAYMRSVGPTWDAVAERWIVLKASLLTMSDEESPRANGANSGYVGPMSRSGTGRMRKRHEKRSPLKELIKVKGFQVAPAELEAVLLEHDAIADVAVVALHLHDIERPRAYIVLKTEARRVIQEADIHAWIETRISTPKYLTGGIAFVDEVLKSASGKNYRKVPWEWAKRDATTFDPQLSSKL